MPVLLGPFDPIKLIFNVINSLMARGILSLPDAKKIIKESLDPKMPEIEKKKFIYSLFINNNAEKK